MSAPGFDLMGQRLAGITFVNTDAMRRLVVPACRKSSYSLRAGPQRDKEAASFQNARAQLAESGRSLSEQPVAK